MIARHVTSAEDAPFTLYMRPYPLDGVVARSEPQFRIPMQTERVVGYSSVAARRKDMLPGEVEDAPDVKMLGLDIALSRCQAFGRYITGALIRRTMPIDALSSIYGWSEPEFSTQAVGVPVNPAHIEADQLYVSTHFTPSVPGQQARPIIPYERRAQPAPFSQFETIGHLIGLGPNNALGVLKDHLLRARATDLMMLHGASAICPGGPMPRPQ